MRNDRRKNQELKADQQPLKASAALQRNLPRWLLLSILLARRSKHHSNSMKVIIRLRGQGVLIFSVFRPLEGYLVAFHIFMIFQILSDSFSYLQDCWQNSEKGKLITFTSNGFFISSPGIPGNKIGYGVTCAAWSPDGNLIATGSVLPLHRSDASDGV